MIHSATRIGCLLEQSSKSTQVFVEPMEISPPRDEQSYLSTSDERVYILMPTFSQQLKYPNTKTQIS